MASKLLNLLALSSIAIMACSFGATPTTALSVDTHNVVRHLPRSHDAIARRKRASGKRCKQRPSSPAPPPPEHKNKQDTHKQDTHKGTSDKPSSGGGAVSTGGHYSGGKRGLAWPNGDDPALSKYKTDKISWLYTWSPHCPSKGKQLGFQCVPMLWGDKQIGDFKALVKKGYANTVLGMNEVNQREQADIQVPHGVELWKTYIQPLKAQGYYLVSPSTTSAPSGVQWIKDFLDQCDGCTVDAVALHYYDVDPDDFIAYIENYHKQSGNRKVWVTEFACQNFNGGAQCSKDEVFNFFQKAMAFMDSTDYVEAYSAFGVMHDMQGVNTLNQLMGGSGSPTELGNFYIHH
jgi:hypothetical protein